MRDAKRALRASSQMRRANLSVACWCQRLAEPQPDNVKPEEHWQSQWHTQTVPPSRGSVEPRQGDKSNITAVALVYWTYPLSPSHSRQVPGNEFVRGFLQHTLPRNFQRLRYYGFASPNSKLQLAWVRMLVWFYLGWCYLLATQVAPDPIEKPPVRCAECGGEMQLTAITDGSGRLLYNHPLPYLDSS